MTRHERRRKAKAIRIIMTNDIIVQANLSSPRPSDSAERLFRMMAARPSCQKGGSVYDGGLHRNNAMPARPQLASAQRKGMPTHRVAKTGKMRWNLDSYVDNYPGAADRRK